MKLYVAWRVGGEGLFEEYTSVDGASDPKSKAITVQPHNLTIPKAWMAGVRALMDTAPDSGPRAI